MPQPEGECVTKTLTHHHSVFDLVQDGMNMNLNLLGFKIVYIYIYIFLASKLKETTESENELDSDIVCDGDLEIDFVVFSLCESSSGRKAKRKIA